MDGNVSRAECKAWRVSMENRIAAVERNTDAIYELCKVVGGLQSEVKDMRDDFNDVKSALEQQRKEEVRDLKRMKVHDESEMRTDIRNLTTKGSKRWDAFVWLVIGGMVTWFLSAGLDKLGGMK